MQEYLGTLDDVIVRHRPVPWGSRAMVDAILAEQLLYGAPGILNDGYLVQHPVISAALLARDPVLVELLDRDFLTVASVIQPPSRSIELRAAGGVASHRALVDSPGWPMLARVIDDLPRPAQMLDTKWPTRSLAQGFARLAGGLLSRLDGIAAPVAPDRLALFLQGWLAEIERHPFAARTRWEALLDDAGFTGAGRVALMDLADLIYHLNFAMLLAADRGTDAVLVTAHADLLGPLLGVAVETQIADLPDAGFAAQPVLNLPAVRALLDDTGLGEARAAFRADPSAATLAAYLDLLRAHPDTAGAIVPPASVARLQGDRIGVLSWQGHAALRLTIPQAVADEFAAQVPAAPT